jgi:hypothetical protein
MRKSCEDEPRPTGGLEDETTEFALLASWTSLWLGYRVCGGVMGVFSLLIPEILLVVRLPLMFFIV